MFYVEGNKSKLRQVMKGEGLREMRFKFDLEGSKVLANF